MQLDLCHGHHLLALAAIALERLHLCGEGACELSEGALGALLLRDILPVDEATCERHGRHMNGGHLTCEHRFDLVFWFYAFGHGEDEIERLPVELSAACRDVLELLEQAVKKIQVAGAERVHQEDLRDRRFWMIDR